MTTTQLFLICPTCGAHFKKEEDTRAHCLLSHQILTPACSTREYYKDVLEIDKKRKLYYNYRKIVNKHKDYYIENYGVNFQWYSILHSGSIYERAQPVFNNTHYKHFISCLYNMFRLRKEIEKAGFMVDEC